MPWVTTHRGLRRSYGSAMGRMAKLVVWVPAAVLTCLSAQAQQYGATGGMPAAGGGPSAYVQPSGVPVAGAEAVAPGLAAAPQPTLLPPPFVLSPAEQSQLERVLKAWEERSAAIKTFECDFTRWEFDPVAGSPNEPARISRGKILYAAPDKGLFRVDEEVREGRFQPAVLPERWLCDGRSIYEYRFETKQVVETVLPPELRGKAITEGPLPFLFGASAESLLRRYYMRVITPSNVQNEIWLEAHPKYQQEAANFLKAELILKLPTMEVFALQLFYPSAHPSTQARKVYQFERLKVNAVDPLRIFKEDPFKPNLPDRSWSQTVESSGTAPNGAAAPSIGARPMPQLPR
ncbi:MAG: TIGR03009 domain-containing protein [Thermogutta sp.]|nr:TIGR03009 domain-containing protein [Thermogutta sp.]